MVAKITFNLPFPRPESTIPNTPKELPMPTMSRDLNQLANLNTVEDGKRDDGKRNEAELQMFSDTNFFDLDIGRSTDIATTVDELLMQQEKQIQYPHKQQQYDDMAGPSYTPSNQPMFQPQMPISMQAQAQHTQPIPFDLSTFSLADELPQTSLSILDIDPLFHEHQQQQQQQQQQVQQQQHQQQQRQQQQRQQQQQQQRQQQQQLQQSIDFEMQRDVPTHRTTRHPPMQRHELADLYAPKPESAPKIELSSRRSTPEQGSSSSSGGDDEKRRRNTAASARFRIKKKMREQEMEKNLKAMQQKLSDQEERIKQLEMENNWLKNLVVEKNTERETSSLGKLRAEFMQNKA